MTKLAHIAGPKDDSRDGDVVFIHGLGGHPIRTWRVGETRSLAHQLFSKERRQTWADWFSEDKPEVCIWSLGYDAAPSKWIGSPMALTDRATNALALLDGQELGAKPICFVTHSMGGLLAKQILRHASNVAYDEYGTISNATCGVVFFSTPHAGAELADFVNSYLRFFLRTSVAVQDLEAHHPHLRELTQWYRNSAPKLNIDTKVFYETETTKGVTVVNPTSADPGIPNVTPIPVDANHLTICAPTTKDSLVYLQTSKFVDEVFNPSHQVLFDASAPEAIEAVKQLLAEAFLSREQTFQEERQAYQEQITNLTEAVNALARQREEPEPPPGVDEAMVFLTNGDTAAAEVIFKDVEERKAAEGAGANKEAAEAARHRGALAFLHDTKAAIEAYRRAIELDSENAKAWNGLGSLLLRIGNLTEAQAAFHNVLELSEASDNPQLAAIGFGNLAHVHQHRGELDQAETMNEKSLALNKALGFEEGMAGNYNDLGTVYEHRGDFELAETMYKESLALCEALGLEKVTVNNYGNLGNVYLGREELDLAEAMYNKSLALCEALGLKEAMADNYDNLGILNQKRGDFDQAEWMHTEALDLNKALVRKEGMARNYINLGILYMEVGHFDQAEAMYKESLAFCTAVGLKKGMVNIYGNLGNLYRMRDELDEAEAMYKESLALCETLGFKEEMAGNYENLGALYCTRGEFDQAEAMWKKSLLLFQEIGAMSRAEHAQACLDELH